MSISAAPLEKENSSDFSLSVEQSLAENVLVNNPLSSSEQFEQLHQYLENSTEHIDGHEVEPFVIGVAGASASGKSTVCESIIQSLGDQRCVMICLDWFYKGLPPNTSPTDYNFDHPNALNFSQLVDVVDKMKSKKPVEVPIYDFCTHSQSGTISLPPADIIIIEGILTFYEKQVRDLMHMKIFTEEDPDVCLCRRIERDVKFRGRDVSSILHQYLTFVKPAYDQFIGPTKRYADIIVPRGGKNHVAIDLIVKHISMKLDQDDLGKIFPNVKILKNNSQIRRLMTIIRSDVSSREDFIFFTNRLLRLVLEHALSILPFKRTVVFTPNKESYHGFVSEQEDNIAAICIMRSGEAMERNLREICSGASFGRMLIEKSPNDPLKREIIYRSIPRDIEKKKCILLLTPVVTTGRKESKAILELLKEKCSVVRIILVALVASPEALRHLYSQHEEIRIVSAEVDRGLDENNELVPGLGSFSNRYFGT